MVNKKPLKISVICSCYKSDKYLDSFFKNVLDQTNYSELQVIIHFSSPSLTEKQILQRYVPVLGEHLNFGISEKLIPVYCAWNYCVNRAEGNYLCIWNVDDRRVPDSLARMSQILDGSSDVLFTYGDYVIVEKMSQQEGKYIASPEFDSRLFHNGMFVGPFFMWRKEAVKRVGLFDEQFLSGGDYDYAVRLSFAGLGKKTHGLVGYYLNEGVGASTGGSHLPQNIQPVERTAIELRYAAYDRTISLRGFSYIGAAKNYRLDQILVAGVWKSISEIITGYNKYLADRDLDRRRLEREFMYWKIYHPFVAIYRFLIAKAKTTLRPIYKRLVH